MNCTKCNNETYIDQVTPEGRYVYVCVNPKCELYRKAETLTGEAVATQIQPNET